MTFAGTWGKQQATARASDVHIRDIGVKGLGEMMGSVGLTIALLRCYICALLEAAEEVCLGW